MIERVDLGNFRFRGRPGLLDHSAAFAQWSPVILELNIAHRVEPPELRDALGIVPGTVSHISWWADDLAGESGRLEAAGGALLTESIGGAVADWFEEGPLFAHPIEIHQPTEGVRWMWDSLRGEVD